ncbi:MAG TPA: hypothetical protein VGJ15_00090 [Pirellulales bacterium]
MATGEETDRATYRALLWRYFRQLFSLKSLAVIFVAALGGSVVGSATNLINGALCTQYFIDVMGWYFQKDIHGQIIEQGSLEGIVCGAVFAVLYLILISAISIDGYKLKTVLWSMVLGYAAALGLWCIGGLLAIIYVGLAPDADPRWFGYGRLASYAWVRGSIMAIEFGGPLAVAVAVVGYTLRIHKLGRTNKTN